MINVVYDYQIFSFQEYGGISRYFYELALRIAKADGFSASVVSPLHMNGYLTQGGIEVKGIKIPKFQRGVRLVSVANRLLAPWPIRAGHPQILHETYYQSKACASVSCPKVVTVYDMIHEKYPDNFSQRDQTSEAKLAAVKRADHVICISDSTRRDLIEMFGISPNKVTTIHLGFSLTQSDDGERTAAGRPSRPFLLYVGQRSGYKNFSALLKAYAMSPSLTKNFDLLAFGGGALTVQEMNELRALGIEDRVRQVSGSDAVLARIYRSASAFVYPSLYEGFGIPPLEAMSFNCPVVCSNTSSIPEVVGDAARLFDPLDVDDMRASIEAIVHSSTEKERLTQLGKERLQLFSWDRCASETMTIYRDLAS